MSLSFKRILQLLHFVAFLKSFIKQCTYCFTVSCDNLQCMFIVPCETALAGRYTASESQSNHWCQSVLVKNVVGMHGCTWVDMSVDVQFVCILKKRNPVFFLCLIIVFNNCTSIQIMKNNYFYSLWSPASVIKSFIWFAYVSVLSLRIICDLIIIIF